MIITVYPIAVIEVFACLCSMSRLFHFFALNATISIAETIYRAYFTLGLLTYAVALLGYVPFLVSLARMTWYDSESRRLIFYRSCLKLYVLIVGLDMWAALSTTTNTTEFCELSDYMPEEPIIISMFQVNRHRARLIMVIMCQYRLQMHRLFNMLGDHS